MRRAQGEQRVDSNSIEQVRIILLDQAELFDDAASYAAGVEDALDALVELESAPERQPLTTAGGWFG